MRRGGVALFLSVFGINCGISKWNESEGAVLLGVPLNPTIARSFADEEKGQEGFGSKLVRGLAYFRCPLRR